MVPMESFSILVAVINISPLQLSMLSKGQDSQNTILSGNWIENRQPGSLCQRLRITPERLVNTLSMLLQQGIA